MSANCPLCKQPNDCQLNSTNLYKGPCWCMEREFPDALLQLVPAEDRNKSCICKKCYTKYVTKQMFTGLTPGDFYFEDSKMVFTRTYLLRRGQCCHSNCRHCPYPKRVQQTN